MQTVKPVTIKHTTCFLQELGPLFREVQLKGVFADSKTFNDCVPKYPCPEILRKYEEEKDYPTFDLTVFVIENFELPDFQPQLYESDPSLPIEAHIYKLWPVLTREHHIESGSSLIPLPYPYIVPGGRFRGMYYWDSYFTMLGLQVSGLTGTMVHIMDNLVHFAKELKFIPNANRTYYLGRSQPPLLALMIDLLAETEGNGVWNKYLEALETEYAFWMEGAEKVTPETPASERVVRMEDGTLLNRYWDRFDDPRPESYKEDVSVALTSGRDPHEVYRHIRAAAESGWDFSSRWLKDQRHMESIYTTEIVPVDLNCLLLYVEEAMIARYQSMNRPPDLLPVLERRAQQRRKAINTYFWDENEGFFFDYNHILKQRTPIYSLAGVFPLFLRYASDVQAAKAVGILESRFLQPGGFMTTLHQSGQQWDAPNGWAPLQWFTYTGLRNYGYFSLARKGKERWLATNKKVYELTGKLTEKYNVTHELSEAGGGEYPNQDGFGWTNAIFLKLSSIAEVDSEAG